MEKKTSPSRKVVAIASFPKRSSLRNSRAAGGTFISERDNYAHLDAFNTKGGASWMNNHVSKETFNQFDKRITDKLSDIRIDTEKLSSIDEKTQQMQQDVSSAQTDIKNMQTSFDTSLSSIKNSVDNIDDNMSGILEAKFESLEGKIANKISNIQWVTGLSALGIVIAILLS